MFYRAIETLTGEDVRALVDDAAQESDRLDFKRAFSSKDESEALRDFCRDVAAFANADGGDIIFGVVADNGVATKAVGIDPATIERAQGRMQDAISRMIRPRPIDLEWKSLKDSEGSTYLLLRVRKSWRVPHLVCDGTRFEAPKRGGGNNRYMDVEELRREFDASGRLLDEIGGWRAERLAALSPAITFPPPNPNLALGARVVVHVVPLGSGARPYRFTAKELAARSVRNQTMVGEGTFRINLHGAQVQVSARSATQTFRSGRIEAVHVFDGRNPRSTPTLPIQELEQYLLIAIHHYLCNLQTLGLAEPVMIFIALLGIRGWKLAWQDDFRDDPQVVEVDSFELPEFVYESPAAFHPLALRLAFDAAWNLSGIEVSKSFDASGAWQGRPLGDAARRFDPSHGAAS